MHIIPFEIPPPKNEADFERMCAQVYGVVFNDRIPKMNGRRGQMQGGVDVFVKELGVGRVGMQQRHLAERYVRARRRANSPPVARPVAVRMLFCSVIPWAVEDKSSPNIEPATGVPLPSRSPDQVGLEAATSNDQPSGVGAADQTCLVVPP